jgi:hypothetical protein
MRRGKEERRVTARPILPVLISGSAESKLLRMLPKIPWHSGEESRV